MEYDEENNTIYLIESVEDAAQSVIEIKDEKSSNYRIKIKEQLSDQDAIHIKPDGILYHFILFFKTNFRINLVLNVFYELCFQIQPFQIT